MNSGADTLIILGALPVVALAALVAVCLLSPPLIRFCRRFDLLDHPNGRKPHRTPTPRLGGIALAAGIAASLGLAYLIWPELFVDFTHQWPGILWAGALIFAVGIYDDLTEAPAYIKLTAQVTAALLLCLWDFRITTVWVPFVGRIGLGYLSIPLTVAWIVVLTNAINLIDGLDGLASGVSAIGGGFLALVGLLWGVPHVAVIGAALLGANLGFLRFNYPPAHIFMGDSGSLMLGFMCAVASVSVPIKTLTAITMALPLLAVWFPMIEVFTSVGRRLAAGASPMRADHGHWHHLLLRNGWSVQRIIWTYYAMAFAFGLFVPALRLFSRYLVLPVFAGFCALVIGYLVSKIRPADSWSPEPSDRQVEHARV